MFDKLLSSIRGSVPSDERDGIRLAKQIFSLSSDKRDHQLLKKPVYQPERLATTLSGMLGLNKKDPAFQRIMTTVQTKLLDAKLRYLINNVGWIADKWITVAKEYLDVDCAVVYTHETAQGRHVAKADDAFFLQGDFSAGHTNIDHVVQAAKMANATHIYPGMGLLSENPDAVHAFTEAGIHHSGPSEEAIRALGHKYNGLVLAKSAGVSCGIFSGKFSGSDDVANARQWASAFFNAPENLGKRLMLKASAGGGGGGNIVISSMDGFDSRYVALCTKAANLWLDDDMHMEVLMESNDSHVPIKHLEGQVLIDRAGYVMYLGHRDCSSQRHHQKTDEKGGQMPGVSQKIATMLEENTIKLAKAVAAKNYVGALTVEYLSNGNTIVYMEGNTRLQVEHGTTEQTSRLNVYSDGKVSQGSMPVNIPLLLMLIDAKVSFQDLALLAPGERSVSAICVGSAIQARLVRRGGGNVLSRLSFPDLPGVRVFSSYYQGQIVPNSTDQMLAIIEASGPTFDIARTRLIDALTQTEVAGVHTDLNTHLQILNDSNYICGTDGITFYNDIIENGDSTPTECQRVKKQRDSVSHHLSGLARRFSEAMVNRTPPRGVTHVDNVYRDSISLPEAEIAQWTKEPTFFESMNFVDPSHPDGLRLTFNDIMALEPGARFWALATCISESGPLFMSTSLRDEHQSKIATNFRPPDKLEIAPLIFSALKPILYAAQVAGGANMHVEMLNGTQPLTTLKNLSARRQGVFFHMLVRAANCLSYQRATSDVQKATMDAYKKAGMTALSTFDAQQNTVDVIQSATLAYQSGLLPEASIVITMPRASFLSNGQVTSVGDDDNGIVDTHHIIAPVSGTIVSMHASDAITVPHGKNVLEIKDNSGKHHPVFIFTQGMITFNDGIRVGSEVTVKQELFTVRCERPYTLAFYKQKARELLSARLSDDASDPYARITSIYLKDAVGLVDPDRVGKIVAAIRSVHSDMKKNGDLFPLVIHYHTHCTAGDAVKQCMAALKNGGNIVDVGHDDFIASDIGINTGQADFSDLLHAILDDSQMVSQMTDHHAATLRVVLNRLTVFKRPLQQLSQRYRPYHPEGLEHWGGRENVEQHHAPGAMIYNAMVDFRGKLPPDKQRGEAWIQAQKGYMRLLEEADKILFGGYGCVMVTPLAKLVGDLAGMMHFSGKTCAEDVLKDPLSFSWPDAVKSYLKGKMGHPQAQIGWPAFREGILKKWAEEDVKTSNTSIPAISAVSEFSQKQGALRNILGYKPTDALTVLAMNHPSSCMTMLRNISVIGPSTYLSTPVYVGGLDMDVPTNIHIPMDHFSPCDGIIDSIDAQFSTVSSIGASVMKIIDKTGKIHTITTSIAGHVDTLVFVGEHVERGQHVFNTVISVAMSPLNDSSYPISVGAMDPATGARATTFYVSGPRELGLDGVMFSSSVIDVKRPGFIRAKADPKNPAHIAASSTSSVVDVCVKLGEIYPEKTKLCQLSKDKTDFDKLLKDGGKVVAIYVQNGETVESGDLMAVISSDTTMRHDTDPLFLVGAPKAGQLSYKKNIGDSFSAGDIIAEVTDDKETLPIQAHFAGVLTAYVLPENGVIRQAGEAIFTVTH